MTRFWPAGQPVTTWDNREEEPAGFAWQGGLHAIEEFHNRWRVHTRWWDAGETIWREYVKVTTGTGLLCLLYRDLRSEGWFLVRIYD